MQKLKSYTYPSPSQLNLLSYKSKQNLRKQENNKYSSKKTRGEMKYMTKKSETYDSDPNVH